MSPLKFVKAVSKTYFAERDKIRNRSKRWWSFTFIVFFSLFLFQIYAAYTDWQLLIVGQAIDNVNTLNPDEFWQTKVGALSWRAVSSRRRFARRFYQIFSRSVSRPVVRQIRRGRRIYRFCRLCPA
jgi:hypothetical protein